MRSAYRQDGHTDKHKYKDIDIQVSSAQPGRQPHVHRHPETNVTGQKHTGRTDTRTQVGHTGMWIDSEIRDSHFQRKCPKRCTRDVQTQC